MKKSLFLRNLIFGAEDALVSSVGVLFGIASSGQYLRSQIIITGLIVIAVEALSMGVGSFLTEESLNDVEKKKSTKVSVSGGLVMFLSYALAGTLVLTPYLLLAVENAKIVSVGVTFVTLFGLGYLPTRNYKAGLRMLIVAGLAILVGFAIGSIS